MSEAYARLEPSLIPILRMPDMPGWHEADLHRTRLQWSRSANLRMLQVRTRLQGTG
jgi:hypothetical protein